MANPYIDFRDTEMGRDLGRNVALGMRMEVHVPVWKMAVTTSGTGVDTPVLTRASQNEVTYVHTGDGDEQFSRYHFDASPFIFTSDAEDRGFALESVRVLYTIGTAAADDVKVYVDKVAYASSGATKTAVTVTYATDHDAAGERNTVADHNMLVTVSTPDFSETSLSHYAVEIEADINNTTVFTLRGAFLTYRFVGPNAVKIQ